MREIAAIATIAQRDVIKLFRDRTRIIATLIFPLVFIGVLGGSLQSNLADEAGYNFLAFIFAGVLGQTLFQSTASGIISLIEDRENDFSREIFISPISRYSIIIGKIIGETLVAMLQLVGIVIFGLILGVPMTIFQIISLIPFFIIVCLFGGAFGVIVMSNLTSQRAANQIFPFLIFPQFFLAGVFAPIKELPLVLEILSRIVPMTYAVDLMRAIFFLGDSSYDKVVLFPLPVTLAVIAIYSTIFVVIGTYMFIRNEKNK